LFYSLVTPIEHNLNVIYLIKDDHKAILNSYSSYKKSTSPADKLNYSDEIIKLVSQHTFCEEIAVYPHYPWILPNGDIHYKRSIKEHKEQKEAFYELQQLSTQNPEFNPKVRNFNCLQITRY
jgi:hypothetical protein